MTTKAKVSEWEKEFNQLIANYPNNLEITYGEVVDGNLEPIKDFIAQIESEAREGYVSKQELREVLDKVANGLIWKIGHYKAREAISEMTKQLITKLNLTEQEGEDE